VLLKKFRPGCDAV